MTEARKVLHTRKTVLEKQIRLYEGQEKEIIKELEICRTTIKYRRRLLDEVLDVYNTLKKEID